MFLFRPLALICAAFLILAASAGAAPLTPVSDQLWNQDWQFHLETPTPKTGTDGWSLDDALSKDSWEQVNLPHSVKIEPYTVSNYFQGLCWYQKVFTPEPWMKGRKVTLEIEGAMQVADIWVDGRHQFTHEGGYLPFTLDLTDVANRGRPATIVVRLDNRDNHDVPPGTSAAHMDFCYFGGLYRNVHLHVTDPLHITDDVAANKVAGGGVFVRYENVSDQSADVLVSTEIRNDGAAPRNASVVVKILDANKQVVAEAHTLEIALPAGQDHSFEQTLQVRNPLLWSTDRPSLYTLVAEVVSNGQATDVSRCRIGIRTFRSDPKLGFFLNGKHMVPEGANRHQAYPYIGNALSDAEQYRDAVKLKEEGFQIIRLSHYPQAPAFLDACDQLGMLTLVCIPGWQFFNDTDHFKSNVEQNLRETIRWDRNHASCVLWEITLNETYKHDEFFHHLVEVAHQEYPGDQMITCGDSYDANTDVIGYEVPYSGWSGGSRTGVAHGVKTMHREYGDYEFGPYSRASRGGGEKSMLVQAWNYQTAMNRESKLPYTWGECIWEGIDNSRGMAGDTAACGAYDLVRLPKFMGYFYQSQRDPHVTSPYCKLGPMLYIANYWTPKSPSQVVVYSNADEVELFVNGKSLGRRKPDNGPDIGFSWNGPAWMNGTPMPSVNGKPGGLNTICNGDNATGITHPPFTFSQVPFEPGELKAIAYLDGKPVQQSIRRTPRAAAKLVLYVDDCGRKLVADGSDGVFIHAQVEDDYGTRVPDSQIPVTFTIDGAASIVGDNPRAAEAGIASILLRSTTSPRPITIHAHAAGLPDAELAIQSVAQ